MLCVFVVWVVNLPAAWDVILSFCGLAFFGWLAFVRLNDDEVRRVPEPKRALARDNLRLLDNYFLVAFLFFIVSLGMDYGIHNVTLLGDFFNVQQATSFLILAVGTTGAFGLALIVMPMVFARGIGQRGKGLADLVLPSLGLVFSFTVCAAINVIFLLYLLPHLDGMQIGGQLILVSEIASWFGAYVNWKYWESGRLFSILGILQFATAIMFMVGVALNLPLFYGPETFQTVAKVVTITTTVT